MNDLCYWITVMCRREPMSTSNDKGSDNGYVCNEGCIVRVRPTFRIGGSVRVKG